MGWGTIEATIAQLSVAGKKLTRHYLSVLKSRSLPRWISTKAVSDSVIRRDAAAFTGEPLLNIVPQSAHVACRLNSPSERGHYFVAILLRDHLAGC